MIATLSFFTVIPSASECKTLLSPNGYFTEHEQKIIVNRVLRDDPTKSEMHNRQPLTLSMIWKALKDYDMWPMYIVGLCFEVPTRPLNSYLTLTMKNLGFDTTQTNLLTIPTSVLSAITVSTKTNYLRLELILSSCFWLQ